MKLSSEIINILRFVQPLSRSEIANLLSSTPSISSIKREIASLVENGKLVIEG